MNHSVHFLYAILNCNGLAIVRSVDRASFSLYIQQWYMSYSLRAGSGQTPDDGQRNCPKHAEFYSKNNFEKLVHLVGFIIIIHNCNTFRINLITHCRLSRHHEYRRRRHHHHHHHHTDSRLLYLHFFRLLVFEIK